MAKKIILGLLSCFPLLSFALKGAEHLVWDKTPIYIELPKFKEKTIVFPSDIQILHSELKNEQLAVVMKAANTLYIKSLAEFDDKSMFVELPSMNEKIKLNFSSHSTSHNERPAYIEVNQSSVIGSELSHKTETNDNAHQNINPISLTRFAIQSLFVPERVIEKLEGVGRVAMETQKTVHLLYGGSVTAHPLISFGGNGLVVTAIELKNNLTTPVSLSPSQVIGHWQTATFYPLSRLEPKGTPYDKTTLFVTSNQSFGQALAEIGEVAR